MYLSGTQLRALSEATRLLAELEDEALIRERVGSLMMQALGAQFYASYVWSDAQQRFDGRIQLNMDPANLLRYEQHFHACDPITFRMQPFRRAVRASEVLSREALVRSEFFNDFLARDGLHWGINLYAWDGATNIGDMRIWRDRRRSDFSDDDARILDLVRPAFVAALRRCQAADRRRTAGTHSPVSRLTGREQDVARLAARGLSDKEIARDLSIGVATVRTHIERAFRKLGVRNRVGLAQALLE